MLYQLVIWDGEDWSADGYGEDETSSDPKEIEETANGLWELDDFSTSRFAVVELPDGPSGDWESIDEIYQ